MMWGHERSNLQSQWGWWKFICLTGRTTAGGRLWRKEHIKKFCRHDCTFNSHKWWQDDSNVVIIVLVCAHSSRHSVNSNNSFVIKNIMTVFFHYIASFIVSVSLLCVCVWRLHSHHFFVTMQQVSGGIASCHYLLVHFHVILTCKILTFTYVNARGKKNHTNWFWVFRQQEGLLHF